MTIVSDHPPLQTGPPPPATADLLVATGVRKAFRSGETELVVLRDADFHLRPGEFVAIEGRSGSGKSTLLHVLAALDSVDAGTLAFAGRAYGRRTPPRPGRWRMRLLGGAGEGGTGFLVRLGVYAAAVVLGLVLLSVGWPTVMHAVDPVGRPAPTAAQRRDVWVGLGVVTVVALLLLARWAADVALFCLRMFGERPAALLRNKQFGFVFQSYHLLPELNVLENTMLAPAIEFSWAAFRSRRAALRQRATELLTQLGLGHRLRHRPSVLSGGERQRVAIARALMNRPAVLFADEPTGNLDTETGRQIMDVLETLHREQGQTIVMVTHDRSLAREADRVLVLRDGRLEEEERS